MTSESAAPRQDGYEEFFGFNTAPFSLSTDPRFRFPSAAHEAALVQVMYALERREPVIVITGDIGLGKTLLCRSVLERLPRKTFLSIIDDPLLGRDDLLKRILEDFGVISAEHGRSISASRHDLAHAMNAFLASLAPLDAHAVVIVDEAQHLQPEVLEQIRLLANTSDERGTLLQIVLVGQPNLKALLDRPELQQLRQRVTRHVSLTALTDAEVQQYIVHRLAVAREARTDSPLLGADDLAREVARWNASTRPMTFTDDAIQMVARMSHGIPRMVNVMCDRALEVAFVNRSRTVAAPAVEHAAQLLHLPDALSETERELVHEGDGEPAHDLAYEPARDLAPEAATVADQSIQTRPPARMSRYAIATLAVVVAGVMVWFAVQTLRPEPVAAPHPDGTPMSRPQPSNGAGSAPAARPAAPVPAPSTPVAPIPAATPNPSVPDAAAATGDSFEIVVASFRTEARASEVVAQLVALGQPARKQLIGEWQEVLAGPFASEASAKAAQEQLDRQGFSGTNVVRVTQ